MTDLYETDILLWSERQAEQLRRHAATTQINTDIDWPNIIEEIDSVGRSELRAVESNLTQALLHILKLQAWPDANYVEHWQTEVRAFRIQAIRRFSPSMRQRIDLDQVFRDAIKIMLPRMDGQPPLPLPATCPVTLDELLQEP